MSEEVTIPRPEQIGRSLAALSKLPELMRRNIEIQTLLLEYLKAMKPVEAKAPEIIIERRMITEERELTKLGIVAVPILSPNIVTIQRPFQIKHYNSSTSSRAGEEKEHMFDGTPLWFLMDNRSSTQDIYISLDGKKQFWKTVDAGAPFELPIWAMPEGFKSMWIKADQSSIPYEIVAGEV